MIPPSETPPPPPPAILPQVSSSDDIFRVIFRRWPLVAAAVVATMVLAWFLAAMQPKRYRASAIAVVAPVGEVVDAHELYRGVEVLQQRTIVATIAALASMPFVERQALGAVRTAQGGGYKISAAVLPNTNLLRIDVEGGDAKAAAAVANEVPELLGLQTRAMYKLYGVSMVSPAVTPREAVFPRVGRTVVAGFVIGLLLGAGLAFALDKLPQRSRG